MTTTPDALFEHLLKKKELISYKDAYEKLIRPLGEQKWLNTIHGPEVLRVALQSRHQTYEGLRIQLDALIVGKDTKEPGGNYFTGTPPASKGQWAATFGGWALCSC